MTIPTKSVEPNADGKYQCPDCDKPPYDDRAHLGIHRKSIHGVMGVAHPQRRMSPKAVRAHRAASFSPAKAAAYSRLSTPPRVVDRMKRLYNGGVGPRDIAERVGVSYWTVLKYVKGEDFRPEEPVETRTKVGRPKGSRNVNQTSARFLTADEMAEIYRLNEEGLTRTAIAEQLGRSATAVDRVRGMIASGEYKPTNTTNHTTKETNNGNGVPATTEHTDQHSDEDLNKNLIYLYGRIEREVESFCLGHTIPVHVAAAGIIELLSFKAGGRLPRLQHRVPALRS